MLNEVADGVWVRQSEWVWSNAVVVRAEDGLVLVDPGIHGSELAELADDVERLGLPVGRVALALAMTVRFIPVLATRAGDLSLAWRARSAKRPLHRLLNPLALAALDEAERSAEALRARSNSV